MLDMKRREFVTLLGGAAAAWPLAARAQQPAAPVFGILLVFSRESAGPLQSRCGPTCSTRLCGRPQRHFRCRYADGQETGFLSRGGTRRATAAVIATFGDASGLAAKAATTTIPIVSMSEDLVRANRDQHETTGGQYHRREHHGHRARRQAPGNSGRGSAC